MYKQTKGDGQQDFINYFRVAFPGCKDNEIKRATCWNENCIISTAICQVDHTWGHYQQEGFKVWQPLVQIYHDFYNSGRTTEKVFLPQGFHQSPSELVPGLWALQLNKDACECFTYFSVNRIDNYRVSLFSDNPQKYRPLIDDWCSSHIKQRNPELELAFYNQFTLSRQ